MATSNSPLTVMLMMALKLISIHTTINKYIRNSSLFENVNMV